MFIVRGLKIPSRNDQYLHFFSFFVVEHTLFFKLLIFLAHLFVFLYSVKVS